MPRTRKPASDDLPADPPATKRKAPKKRKNLLNALSAGEWVQHTKSWFIADGKPRDITADIELHPASFPPDMVARFIRFFTKPGETVLDPFVGCGGTLAAATELGRRSVGIELSRTYYRNTVKRVQHMQNDLFAEAPPEVVHGDAREVSSLITKPVQFCFTSPPYWDMLRKSRGNNDSNHRKRQNNGLPTDYGSGPGDLGIIESYDQYLDELVRVFLGVKEVLDPKRYIVVVLQNVRVPGGEMKPLAWDFASRMSAHFLLQQEFVWCQNQKQLGCWGWPSTYVSNVHHHYCLVFRNNGE